MASGCGVDQFSHAVAVPQCHLHPKGPLLRDHGANSPLIRPAISSGFPGGGLGRKGMEGPARDVLRPSFFLGWFGF